MKVFRNIRAGRRRSFRNSLETNSLLSDSNCPSEVSSVGSWGEGSSISGGTNQLYLLTEYSEDTSNDDASSLPAHIEGSEADSPSHWSNSSTRNMAMVVYTQPGTPRPLPDSIRTWFQAVDALVHSREMKILLGTSCDLVVSVAVTTQQSALAAGGRLLDTALLPVTIPLHVASTATCLIAGIAGNILNKVASGGQSTGEEQSNRASPIESFIHHVINVVPRVVNTAGKITADVGSVAVRTLVPALGIENGNKQDGSSPQSSPSKACTTMSGESSAERENLLQRLSLDFQQPTPTKSSSDSAFTRATPSDISKNLLRVDDIDVMVSPDPAMAKDSRLRRALFVDLGSEFSDDVITRDALAKLIQRGLDVTSTNVAAHFAIQGFQTNSSLRIDWKAEGQTGRVLRKLCQLDSAECYRKLNNHVLVWSGKYNGPKYFGCENPLFLARGVVRRSPREFFDMLWDSNRTGEYNNFSLGRSDTLVIDNTICSTGDSGAKIIKSETRVPFAGITVTLSALMHGKKFLQASNEFYVIVSRSLCSGTAGCHVGSTTRVEKNNKNEILLGVNIMRPVPGHPDLTDLMSVSQVSSSMVPQFLAFKIGMMGLEDFFSNVRKT